MAEYRNIVEGPKWAGFSSFLKDECHTRGLKATIDVERGWLTEKVRFFVTGDDTKIGELRRCIEFTMNSYNKKFG